jgi:hypothetical protein
MTSNQFLLAPMSRSIRIFTGILLVLPIGILVFGISRGSYLAFIPSILMGLIYFWVWTYFRPTSFNLSNEALRIVWPSRQFELPLAEIMTVETLTAREFKARYGWGMRVGAGGLWGGFGLLVTKRETLRFYISRLDGFVLIKNRSTRTLLITPADPEQFVESLELLRIG